MKELKIPELAESITEGTIAKLLVKQGDFVKRGDVVLELETDKVNVEVQSEYTGVITELTGAAGDDVVVGDIFGLVREDASTDTDTDAPVQKEIEKVVDESPETIEKKQMPQHVIATPSVRRLARELDIDLEKVETDDPLGRIYQTDLKENKIAPSKPKQGVEVPFVNASEGRTERIKMSRRRQTIAKRLVEATQEAAMLTTFNEVDMSAIMKLRKERKDRFFEKHGVKLGFMSFFTKAVVASLRAFPLLNAEIDENEIVLKKFYDIGIAVSTDDGLVVPVVRDADRLDFAGIEKEIGKLGKKAKDKALQFSELQGGTFTITNGGIFGSLLSTPILNTPQVGILGMHTIQKRAIVMPDDSIEARPMMYLALSYDHRIVDGKEAVQFLVHLKKMLEDPYDLLLEG